MHAHLIWGKPEGLIGLWENSIIAKKINPLVGSTVTHAANVLHAAILVAVVHIRCSTRGVVTDIVPACPFEYVCVSYLRENNKKS